MIKVHPDQIPAQPGGQGTPGTALARLRTNRTAQEPEPVPPEPPPAPEPTPSEPPSEVPSPQVPPEITPPPEQPPVEIPEPGAQAGVRLRDETARPKG
jgi:hypothetical protein